MQPWPGKREGKTPATHASLGKSITHTIQFQAPILSNLPAPAECSKAKSIHALERHARSGPGLSLRQALESLAGRVEAGKHTGLRVYCWELFQGQGKERQDISAAGRHLV